MRKPRSKKLNLKDDGLMFSKAKQLNDGLSRSFVRRPAIRVDSLKRLTNGGVVLGIEQSKNHVSTTGHIEIGGKRYYMKSAWERNMARHYEWLKVNNQIVDWEYEPRRFMFEKIKRGTNSYLPDFMIKENDKTITWVEIKGYLDQKGKTKIKRFLKYYPKEKLQVIEADDYRAIAKQCKNLVGGWE